MIAPPVIEDAPEVEDERAPAISDEPLQEIAGAIERRVNVTVEAPLPRTGGRSILVASTGGHLTQLTRLADRLGLLGDPLWVTFDKPQSRSMLRGQDVEYVRFTAPRDWRSIMHNLPTARRILREHGAQEVISTGSGIALAFLPVARAMGVPAHYIESAARSQGPSVTGRLLHMYPGIRLYSQYRYWADAEWRYVGSVFDDYEPVVADVPAPHHLKVVVTLGTLDYRFDALVDAVKRAVRPNWRVVWQIGRNSYGELPGEVHRSIDARVLAAHCRAADVIVSHAGVGSALTAMEAGKQPVLVPRDPDRGEHVDAHQEFIAHELQHRKLATRLRPGEITTTALRAAASRRTVRSEIGWPLALSR